MTRAKKTTKTKAKSTRGRSASDRGLHKSAAARRAAAKKSAKKAPAKKKGAAKAKQAPAKKKGAAKAKQAPAKKKKGAAKAKQAPAKKKGAAKAKKPPAKKAPTKPKSPTKAKKTRVGSSTKAAKKRGAVARPPIAAHPDAELTKKQVELLYDRLISERARVTEGMGAHLSEAIGNSESLADEMDMAQRHSEQAYLMRFADKERKLLREITHALVKIEEGEYGVCEGTGEPISFKRLELRPWTRYSVEYKEQIERQRRQHR